MFKNSFEELLFLRFLSKNAEHQRKMNQKMLKTQRELVKIQKQKSARIDPDKKPKADAINIISDKGSNKFDLRVKNQKLNPFRKKHPVELKRKSIFLSILLTLTLGPVGLMYSTMKFAAILTVIFVSAVIVRVDYTVVWFIINTTIISIGVYKTLKWNKDLNVEKFNKV